VHAVDVSHAGPNSGTIWSVDFYGKKSPKVESGERGVAKSKSIPGHDHENTKKYQS
jgi:hypothetical protein